MIEQGFLTTQDKQQIAYKHYKNGKDKVIVVVHGFYNSKESVLLGRLCANLCQWYNVFIFDLRGHGKSSGLFTWTSSENYDLKSVLTYLKGQYKKTAIVAFSFGGSISINVLAETNVPVNSFVCISAPSDCSKIDYKLWKLDWENDIFYSLMSREGRRGKGVRVGPFWLPKQKPVDNVEKIKIPILYIHGDKDWVIDKWHSQALFDKTRSEKQYIVVKGGSHAEYLIRKYPDKIYKEVNSWLENTL